MANICFYKIKVRGTKDACYALINMMPLYSWEKEIHEEEGTDEDYTLLFTGACKWSVSAYTSKRKGLVPYTPEQVAAVQDGDGWDICLEDKSLLLNCEIWCNSKDIDDYCYSDYEHYNKGEAIHDECPKELHIKRGRDYDQGYDAAGKIITGDFEPAPAQNVYKIRFEDNRTYWYLGEAPETEAKVGDLVFVDGAKSGLMGVVKEVSNSDKHPVTQKIISNTGKNIGPFNTEQVDALWDTYGKAKERKEHFANIGLDPAITRKKFVSVMENQWIQFAQTNNDWDAFIKTIAK